MSALGLYFEATGLTAAWLADDGAVSVKRLSFDAAETELADWLQAAGSRIGAAFAAEFRLRTIEFPFTQPGKIRQVLPMQLEDHLPAAAVTFEQQVHIGKIDERGLAVVQLLAKADLEWARSSLLALTPNARTFEADALMMSESMASDPNQVAVWVTSQTTTLVRRHAFGPLTAVSVPIGAARLADAGARANLAARLRGLLPEAPATLYIDGEAEGVKALADIVRTICPNALIETAAETADNYATRVAVAAADRAVQRKRPQWNLAPRRPLLSPELVKSGLLPAIGAPLAIAIFFTIVATVSGTRKLHVEADANRSEMTAIFERNFPRTRIVDPLRQMQAVVDRAGNKAAAGAAGKVIDGLADFHDRITDASNIALAELRTSTGNWTLRGDAPDYGGVERIKSAIESSPTFTDVRVQRAEQTVDKSAIRFSLAWSEKP